MLLNFSSNMYRPYTEIGMNIDKELVLKMHNFIYT